MKRHISRFRDICLVLFPQSEHLLWRHLSQLSQAKIWIFQMHWGFLCGTNMKTKDLPFTETKSVSYIRYENIQYLVVSILIEKKTTKEFVFFGQARRHFQQLLADPKTSSKTVVWNTLLKAELTNRSQSGHWSLVDVGRLTKFGCIVW